MLNSRKARPGLRLWIFLLLLLTACAPKTLTTTAAPVPVLPTSTENLPTAALLPTATQTLQPTPSATSRPAPKPCSPLAVQPLEQISAITTQPFIMPRTLADGTYSDDGHHGIDLGYYTREGKPFTGTPVLSALAGTIAAVIHDRPPYGNMLIVETPFDAIPPALIASQNIPAGNSLYSLYAHLQNLPALTLHQAVTCGQPLAETGLTGFTGGPHLHFETRWGPAGTTFSGMAYYRADTSQEERANYVTWRMSGQFHLFNPMELLSIQP